MPDPTKNESEPLDPSLAVLFDTVEGENVAPAAPEPKGLSLTDVLEAPAEGENAEKKEEKPAEGAEKKNDEAAPAATDAKKGDEAAAAEKPIVRRRSKPAPAPEPTASAPAAASTPVATEKPATDDLLDEERERYELAKFAASKYPEKYKGLDEKFLKFYKDHKEYLEKTRKENPEATFDEHEYQAWLAKNQPKLSPSEVRLLEREQITEVAAARSREEVLQVKEELFRRDEEPKVKREADNFYVGVVNESMPAEVAALVKEKGLDEARKKFPIELEAVDLISKTAADDIEEYLRLTRINPETRRPIRAYDKSNPQHVRVLKLVNEICDSFKESGTGLIKDGKSFLTREEYFRLPPERRAAHWTFDNAEIVRRAQGIAKATVGHLIKQRRQEWEERARAYGYERPSAAPGGPPAGPAASSAPAAPRPSPSPAGSGAAAAASEDQPSALMKVMLGE